MRLLIDGYNLMHAVILPPGRTLGPDGLRKLRHRFLNQLAALIGPVEAYQTTVVFDAAAASREFPRETSHKGMTILFSELHQEADERIEQLIARHSSPRQLTVVSSDHRLRLAAQRRRSAHLTSDAFWSGLEERQQQSRTVEEERTATRQEERRRLDGPDPSEAAYWLEQFRELADSTEARSMSRHADFVPTDEELARIVREVEEEDRRR